MEVNLPINQIICGDNIETMATFPDASIDSIVTDPPYGLSFMGKKWDYDVPSVELWAECLRVLKPGGHLLAFAGTRTQHRMAVRIEDAGFEIRDMIAWVYGSGFPKSLNIGKAIDKAAGAEREVMGSNGNHRLGQSQGHDPGVAMLGQPHTGNGDITAPATEAAKQWDGWGSALKPALEPITMARKPLDGTIAGNVLKHGVGGINVDGCRVEGESVTTSRNIALGSSSGGIYGAATTPATFESHPAGRFPANFCHDGSDEVVGLFPEAPSAGRYTKSMGKQEGEKQIFGSVIGANNRTNNYAGDTGSAARFFYCAKADSKERRGGNHPTVKPLDLMRYLVRLVSPIGAIVLDPFAGSGTTLEAAKLESCRYIGIEINQEYIDISNKRLAQGVLF